MASLTGNKSQKQTQVDIQEDFLTSKKISKLWFGLSIAALLIAGFMSLSFIIGRAPVISEWITDPQWIKRVLIVHVNLALIIFIYAFYCGLYMLIPHKNANIRLPYVGLLLATLATLMLIANVFIPSANPILSNYIPLLDNSTFKWALILFAVSVIITVSGPRLITGIRINQVVEEPIISKAAIPALQSAAILIILSLIVLLISWLKSDQNLVDFVYYDRLLWGAGHILQFVNSAITVAAWLIIAKRLLGVSVTSFKQARILFIIFTLPVLFSPLLLVDGTSSPKYLLGFTSYMRWGIFPVVSAIMLLIFYRVFTAKKTRGSSVRSIQNPYFTGLIVSLFFMIIGFIVGAFIRGSNTLIPAHYHATLGSITVAIITLTYYLLEVFDKPFPSLKIKKWAAYQPIIFGVGQLLFVFGFAYAGAYGLARKSFGAEQIIGSKQAFIGLAVSGIGGLLAITGGLIFLIVIISSFRANKVKP